MNYLEAIRIEHGIPISLEYHRRRMQQTTGCALPPLDIPSGMKKGRVKCRIIYNQQILAIDYTHYQVPTIRSLKIVTNDTIDYTSKYEDRTALNHLFDERGDCDDILIVRNGWVTDTSFCNIVFEKDGTLYTPSTPLLAGTQRSRLLEQGFIDSIPIRPIDISRYQRAYLINAMIELSDCVSIDIDRYSIQGIGGRS